MDKMMYCNLCTPVTTCQKKTRLRGGQLKILSNKLQTREFSIFFVKTLGGVR